MKHTNPNLSGKQIATSSRQEASNELQPYYGQHYDPNDYEPELDFSALLRVIKRYKVIIAAVFAVAVLSSLVVTLVLRSEFTASSFIELNTSQGNVVKFNKLEIENLSQGRYLQSQVTILSSRAIASEVVDRLGLTSEPEYNGQLRQRSLGATIAWFKSLFSTPEPITPVSGKRLAENIYLSRLEIKPVSRSNIIEVKIRGFEPNLAAKIANEHVKAYISLASSRRQDLSSEARSYVENQLGLVEARLKVAEQNLTTFARENNNVDIEDSDNVILNRLSTLNQSLSEVQSARIDAETKYIQAQSTEASNLSETINDPIIVSLKQERASLQAEYLELSKLYKPKYPLMQELDAKIQEVERNITLQKDTLVLSLKNQYEQLQARESTLGRQLQLLKDELFDLRDKAVNYNIMKRGWEADKELYRKLLDRSKELGVAAGTTLNAGSLVEMALPPKAASSPNLRFNLFIAAVLGLCSGLGLAFFLHLLDDRINDVSTLEQLTGLPALTVLPTIATNDDDQRSEKLELRSMNAPGDIFSESLNSLRSSLSYMHEDRSSPKVYAVTSSVAGEGKSLISTNLAVSYAKAGLKSLLIEVDLRRPRLAKVFDAEGLPGLVQCLSEGDAVAVKTMADLKTLSVIFAGDISKNPLKELGSIGMQKLLEKVRQEYDVIILDCPPILGLADTIEISSLVDGLLLVVGAHKVSRKSVEHSVERLRLVNASVLGTVFNQSEPNISGYDHYAYGYYTSETA